MDSPGCHDFAALVVVLVLSCVGVGLALLVLGLFFDSVALCKKTFEAFETVSKTSSLSLDDDDDDGDGDDSEDSTMLGACGVVRIAVLVFIIPASGSLLDETPNKDEEDNAATSCSSKDDAEESLSSSQCLDLLAFSFVIVVAVLSLLLVLDGLLVTLRLL